MKNAKSNYSILKCIYSSSNSGIYDAINTAANRRVVLKTVRTDLMDLSSLSKLQSEYELMSKINSEYVIKPIDFIKFEDSFYIVMEHCEGIPLSEYIKEHHISTKEFLYIAQQITSALSDIHKNGIIHKDINPSNIMYNPKNREIKIIDLGLATEFSYEKSLELNPNSFKGTLYYISPEQTGRTNRPIDFRTDYYSLGVTFFEMLCGIHPFESESPMELIYSHIAKLPPTAKETNPEVPVVLSKIITKLMSKMPEDRYASSDGILFDINQCFDNLNSDGEIAEFELGKGDYTDHLEMPNKIYGRETEIAQLTDAYNHIVDGGKALIAVGGYSGVGKTSLVNELYKPVINSSGFFIRGKFDQYQRNVPYHPLFQAINQFCGYILSEPESRMTSWKERLIEALERDGKMLTDKIPHLKLLVGELPELPEYSPLEEQIKFKTVLQNFLVAIVSPKHPLVLFIDDMHLTDMGSLEVVEDIMSNPSISGLLIVSGYRDNEVTEDHPLMQSLKKMKNNNVNVLDIPLKGLALNSAVLMIAETFRYNTNEIAELAETIYKKTNGNPFYIKQFLNVSYFKKRIRFNRENKTWEWDMAAIRESPVGENVVDYLARNIVLLSSASKLLSFGACIGRSFGIKALSYVSCLSIDVVIADIKPAVSEQIIYPIQDGNGNDDELKFVFSHDRFEQTCYFMLSEEIRSQTHYRIATYFEKSCNPDSPEDQIYIADNYCKWLGSIDSAAEKRRVAEFLFKAAQTAHKISAYDTAERFLRQIITIFPESFENDNRFKYFVYSEYHSVLCSLAKFDDADDIYKLVEQLTDDPVALADSCCMQAVSLSNRGKYKEAFTLGTDLLDRLGVHFPANDLDAEVNRLLDEYYLELRKRNDDGIVDVSLTTDQKEYVIQKVLSRITPAGVFFNPFYSYWAIITNADLLLKYGYSPEGLQHHVNLLLITAPLRNDYNPYKTAYKAMKLAEKNGYKNELYRIYMVFSLLNIHWFENVQASIPYARESCRGNIEVGDFEFACYCYFATQNAILETCSSIDELAAENDMAIAFAQKNGNKHSYGTFINFRQFIKAIKRETLSDGAFDSEQFCEQTYLDEFAGNGMAFCYYYTLRALSSIIYSDFAAAYPYAEKAAELFPYTGGHYIQVLCNFVHSLAICKHIENHDCSEEEKTALFGKLHANQKWLGERAADAPMNFTHLHRIIEAEITAIEHLPVELVPLYENAIRLAEENNRPYHRALICELAAMRLLKLDAPKAAATYLKEAYLAYLSWGAKGKVEQMKQKYQDLLISDFAASSPGTTTTESHSSKIISTASIDLDLVIKAAQVISGEIQLDSILTKLIHVLLEIAGAQDIYYFEKKDDIYVIQAEGHSDGRDIQILQGRPISPDCISMKVVNYVDRTRESVTLDNAANSEKYGNDQHIMTYKCRSVMCIPVMNKGELDGILYLENNLAEGTFDNHRTNVLMAIASQLAISLENAYLFNNLKKLVDERTIALREEITIREKAENKLEDMANHDFLTNLPNRRLFQDILAHSIEIAKLNNRTIGVVFVDLDGFKAINDMFGHDKGDLVLVAVAGRLLNSVRSCDTVSRMGGDEFVLIIENVKNADEIRIICQRIIDSIGKEISLDNKDSKATVTASIGISILPTDGITAEELIRNADEAMYIAKRSGKNQYVFHSEN